jgi:TonB-dependent starch-binding outer membrane protein SusC
VLDASLASTGTSPIAARIRARRSAPPAITVALITSQLPESQFTIRVGGELIATHVVRARVAVRLGVAAAAVAVCAAGAQGQTRISGRVVDATEHAPIAAAAVLVTGTTIGQNTTDSGTFAFRVPADAKTMTVRRIGYLAQTLPIVEGKTEYTITLQKDILRLETQVVTGVVTSVASQNAANAVAVVTTQEVNQVPAPTMENSLEGKIPGAVIESNNGGAPGGGLQIQVRGITSINGNASPLYVVDGIVVDNETVNADENAINNSGGGISSTGQFNTNAAPSEEDNAPNRIADINPDDIESIEILKGASASAIYGSKASAGVVVITTKKGASGKAKWNFSGQVGHYSLSNVLPVRSFPTLASAQSWYANDVAHPSSPGAIAADNAFIQGIYAGPQNYQTELFGNGRAAYQTNVSVSGTSGQTQYYVSGLSKFDNGVLGNTGYGKQSFRTNITQQFASALTVNASGNYIHSDTRRGITGNDNIGISPYNVFSYTPGFQNLQRLTPSGAWPLNHFGPANPFADAAEINTPQEVSRFIGGGIINWTPWRTDHQSIQLNAVGGADLASLHDLLYAPPTLQVEQQIATGLPGASVSNVSQINYFNYAFNIIHRFTGLSWLDATTSAGFNRDRRETQNPVTVGYNLLAGVNAPTVGTVQDNFFYHTEQLDQSLYGQEQIITLDSRLTLTGGVTGERSTNDGDISKFYAYPRFSGSYRIPQFVGFVNDLKVRAAYGQSGNLAPYGVKYTPLPPTQIDGINGFSQNQQAGDPNIKPESETEIEFGFDATMFKSRAQFSATIYQKRLANLLLSAGVAPGFGFSNTFENGGEFTNQGLELSLQMTPIQTRAGFNWINTVTFYRNYSVVNALPVPPFIAGLNFGYGADELAIGRSVSELVNQNITNAAGVNGQAGDFSPGYLMTMGNEITFKGFRVYGLLEWSRNGSVVDLTQQYFDLGPSLSGDSALSAARNAMVSAGLLPYVESASYLKVRELTVGYNLPQRLIARVGFGRVSSARVSFNGYNLWAIYKYKGPDPQVNAFGNQAIGRGEDVTPYPPARSFYLGLDLGL